jgi:hypothetical protein
MRVTQPILDCMNTDEKAFQAMTFQTLVDETPREWLTPWGGGKVLSVTEKYAVVSTITTSCIQLCVVTDDGYTAGVFNCSQRQFADMVAEVTSLCEKLVKAEKAGWVIEQMQYMFGRNFLRVAAPVTGESRFDLPDGGMEKLYGPRKLRRSIKSLDRLIATPAISKRVSKYQRRADELAAV